MVRLQKTAKTEFSRFCDTTGLDGFAFAKESHCLEERFLWIISVPIFFAIMTFSLFVQFAYYSESPTVTSVQLQFPNYLELPSPTICVQLNISAFEDRLKLNRFSSTVKTVRSFYRTIRQPNVKFDYHFNQTLFGLNQGCLINCDYSKGFMMWLVLMTNYIVETGRLESFIQPQPNNLSFLDIRKLIAPAKQQSYLGVTGPIEEHLDVLMANWNLTLLDVVRVVGAALCRIIDLRVKVDKFGFQTGKDLNTSYTYPCTVDRVTWLGPVPVMGDTKEVLCMSMGGLDIFNFTSRSDSVKLLAAPLHLYRKEDWLELEKVRSYGIYLKPGGERVFSLDMDSQNLLRIPAHSLSHVPMEISAVYQAYPAKRGCTEDNLTVLECLSRCRVESFLRLCGCFPMSHFSMKFLTNNGTEICTIKRLTNASAVGPKCLLLTRSNSNSNECDSNCKPPCKVEVYKFYRTPYHRTKLVLTKNESSGFLELQADIVQPYTKAVMHYQRFSYPLYVEKWQKTLIDMIADVGNVSGLYLGASVLALVHVIVYLFVALLNCIFANKISSLASNNSFLLCHKDKHAGYSRNRKLHAVLAELHTNLDQLRNRVNRDTTSLKLKVRRYSLFEQNKI